MAGKILKFLPKSASFSIPNHNNNKSKYMFSGPILPMIPDHYRRKMLEEEEEGEEPTSPKVSCIGQVVNHNKKNNSKKKKMMKKKLLATKEEEQQQKNKNKNKNKKELEPKRTTSSISRMFSRKAKPARRDVVYDSSDDEAVAAAPAAGIGRMRRFASGRVEALKDFDWRTIDNDEKEEVHQQVPHSGPILIGGGKVALEPKKETNIWMRRTRTPPVPLQLK